MMPREISDYQKHLRRVDIPAWEYRRGDWYTIQLFDLMAKADENNKHLLGEVYPEEMAAFMWWYNGKQEWVA
jgi:hypothetical protein